MYFIMEVTLLVRLSYMLKNLTSRLISFLLGYRFYICIIHRKRIPGMNEREICWQFLWNVSCSFMMPSDKSKCRACFVADLINIRLPFLMIAMSSPSFGLSLTFLCTMITSLKLYVKDDLLRLIGMNKSLLVFNPLEQSFAIYPASGISTFFNLTLLWNSDMKDKHLTY